jgi:hypothetical protein
MPMPYRAPPIRPPWQPQPMPRRRSTPDQLTGPASYSTTFPATETPISEGGLWTLGKTNGLDWSNVITTTNKAFGTQSGDKNPPFDDSVAVIRGSWGPDQHCRATVFNTLTPGAGFTAEVEHLLHFTINVHGAFGYECNCSCNSSTQYTEIVRWNGALGDFTVLSHINGISAANGDVFEAGILGNVITVWLNGTQVNTATDSTWTGGNPGIGFWLDDNGAGTPDSTHHGFSNWSAYPLLSMGDPENYGRPQGLRGQAQIQQLLAV